MYFLVKMGGFPLLQVYQKGVFVVLLEILIKEAVGFFVDSITYWSGDFQCLQ